MPLNTQIDRDGKPLEIRWGGFHVAAMVLAASMDSGIGPFKVTPSRMSIYQTDDPEQELMVSPKDAFDLMDYSVIGATPLNEGSYTLKEKYTFLDTRDGEVFTLLPGDVLRMGRSWK